MSAEKRNVSTDALETLGTIIEHGDRDAIHLAVEPVIAGEKLYPGQDIGLVDGKAFASGSPKFLGIVDPFIKGFIPPESKFWLVVYPRQITSLRHVWSHPDFDESNPAESKSKIGTLINCHFYEQWIRDYAATIPIDYDTLMQGADDWVESRKKSGYGNYLTIGGLLEGESVPQEFWTYYEFVRGVKVDESHKESFFSCSC